MSTKDTGGLQNPAKAIGAQPEEINERDRRALSQYLTVLEDVGRAKDADNLYLVVSESGKEYLVDALGGACECPDAEYRNVHCKHQRRVAFATGEEAIPPSIDPATIDDQLGEHVSGSPRVPVTDGGEIIVAGDGAEVLDESDDEDVIDLATVTGSAEPSGDERPDDCQCWDPDGELPCWPCSSKGFETANLDHKEADC